MELPLIRHMDRNLTELGRLSPCSLSLQLSLIPLSTAEMVLESGETVHVGEYMELFTGSGSAGIFRVTGLEEDLNQTRVHLEHGLCTLSDRILFGHWQMGGSGQTLRQIMESMLLFQSMWQLGDCDAETFYSYVFDHENLLSAMVQLLRPLGADYALIPDQTTRPWTVHVRKLPEVPSSELRLSRNLSGIRLKIDTSDMATRLYPFGSGSGGDTVNILQVNHGLPYIESDRVQEWGILESVHTESTVEDAQTLLAVAGQVLESVSEPRVSLVADAHDFSRLTGESLDRLRLGDRCRVCLPERHVTYEERIVGMRWTDVCRDPWGAQLELRNRVSSAEDALSQLTRRSRLQEVYNRGTASETTLYHTENCDAEHPAVFHFFIGDDALHVNAVRVRITTDAFRGQTGTNASIRVRDIESTAGTVRVSVDGNPVPEEVSRQAQWDALGYMTKDAQGRVERNSWHDLVLAPDGICQVVVQLGIRTMIRTLSGAQA